VRRKLALVAGLFIVLCLMFAALATLFFWEPKNFAKDSLAFRVTLPYPAKVVPIYNECSPPVYNVETSFIDGQSPALYTINYGTSDPSDTLKRYRFFYTEQSCTESATGYQCGDYAVNPMLTEASGCVPVTVNVQFW